MGYDPRIREILTGPGSPFNPLSSATAVVPAVLAGLAPWFRTPTFPDNATAAAWTFLPDTTAATTTTDYSEDFPTTIGTYTARANASLLTWDSAVNAPGSTGGSLRWTATATGVSQVRSGANITVLAGLTYTVTIPSRHTAAAARNVDCRVDFYDAAFNQPMTPTFIFSAAQSVINGTGFVDHVFTVTPPTGTEKMELSPRFDLLLNEQAYVDRIRVTH